MSLRFDWSDAALVRSMSERISFVQCAGTIVTRHRLLAFDWSVAGYGRTAPIGKRRLRR